MTAAIKPTFQGEVMLAGWSESHHGGAKVTFWLSDPSDLEAFRALTCRKGNTAGQRFMAALVEIGDDEQPIATSEQTQPMKGGPLSKAVAIMCDDPQFKLYTGSDTPVEWLRKQCAVTSRAELDHNKQAGLKARQIMADFSTWKGNAHGKRQSCN